MDFQQKTKNLRLVVLLLVILLGQSVYGQNNNRPVKKIDWNSVTKGERFQEKSEQEENSDVIEEDTDSSGDGSYNGNGTGEGSGGDSGVEWRPRPPKEDSIFNGDAFKNFAIILIIGVAIFILVLLLKKQPKNIKVKADLDEAIIHAEEDIDKSDLRYLLKMALDQNNLRAALRIYYLIIIKELNQNKLIQYKKDKTNYAYIVEMSGKPEYNDFKNLTMAYEYHWYGDKELNSERFNNLSPAIEKFIGQVKTKYEKGD